MKHKSAMRQHALRRFEERLGIYLSLEEYHALSQQCYSRDFAAYKGQSGPNQILLVNNFRGWRFRLVFDALKGRIVTVLPNTIQKLDEARLEAKQAILAKVWTAPPKPVETPRAKGFISLSDMFSKKE